MYVKAGVGGVVTVLPVLEPCVQSHYFLDQPCSYRWALNGQTPNVRNNTKLPDERHQITGIHEPLKKYRGTE